MRHELWRSSGSEPSASTVASETYGRSRVTVKVFGLSDVVIVEEIKCHSQKTGSVAKDAFPFCLHHPGLLYHRESGWLLF